MTLLPKLSVIIPCYLTPTELVVQLIKSFSYPKNRLEIIIVESGPKSIVQNDLPAGVHSIYSKKRLSCAQAINLGVRAATNELVCNTNPDITTNKDTLVHLAKYMDTHSQVGIAAPKVMRHDELSKEDVPGCAFQPWSGAIKSFSPKVLKYVSKEISVGIVSGCFIIFRKSSWSAVSGFDENYFLYWEDTDFCMKVSALPKDIIWYPQTSVQHLGESRMTSAKLYFIVKNSLFFKMRYTNFIGKMVLLGEVILTLCVKSIKLWFQRDKQDAFFIKGITDFLLGKKGAIGA